MRSPATPTEAPARRARDEPRPLQVPVPYPPLTQHVLWNLAVATMCGLSVGVERQWSGHAQGPRARFAGVRTFTLLGLVSGLAGWLWTAGVQGPAVIVLAGLGALVVVAYLSASRVDVDGTTEVAAFVVMTAGVLAGTGYTALGAGVVALTTLLLVEKRRLHHWVRTLGRDELRAGARFAVMATVILPILPTGPYGPAHTIQPRLLWAMVLFFSGLSFVGYITRHALGDERGYAVAGTLGGLVSSTSVTLTYARLSRNHAQAGASLASGTLGANFALFPRILLATAILALPLARALWLPLVLPSIVAAVLTLRGARTRHRPGKPPKERNPLQFGAALQMAALFQVVLWGVAAATTFFGRSGIYGSAALLGLADMDALTISMAHLVTKGTDPGVAAGAIVDWRDLEHGRQDGHRPHDRPRPVPHHDRDRPRPHRRRPCGRPVLALSFALIGPGTPGIPPFSEPRTFRSGGGTDQE